MELKCYYQTRLELGLTMKYPFTDEVRKKGWKMKDLAFYWGITPRQMSNIAKDPTQLHIDALNGLPEFDPTFLNYSLDSMIK